MGGHAEQVVPTLVGIVIFTFVMAFIISNLGPVGALSPNVPDSFNLGGAYDRFTPTYKIVTPTNISSNPYTTVRQMDFTRSVAPNDHLKGNVYRSSSSYVAGSIYPWEKYRDGVQISFGYIAAGHPEVAYDVSYATISQTMNSTSSNITHYSFVLKPTTTGQAGNYTLVIEVHHLANKTADLYANHFNVTLTAPHTASSVTFWSAIGYLFTFNANWIPTYPWVAFALSGIIDLTIVLCVIRMVW